MDISGATIAVIGGSGFIGRRIVERLAREGARLKVLSRHPDRAKFLKPMGDPGQIAVIAGDASDADALEDILYGTDAVVNTVGILAETGRQRFSRLQADLPAIVGEIMARRTKQEHRAMPLRLVQISAIGADPDSPSNYARTKGEGEARLAAVFSDATILRPSLVFGAGDGFFERFAALALMSPMLPLIGGGRNRIQPVYVGDVAAAAVAALKTEAARGQTYELGGPQVLSFADAMGYLLQAIDRRRLLLPVPFPVMAVAAILMALLPSPPVTRDQLKLLRRDNVVSPDALTLADLGISSTPMELVVPEYLSRYRPHRRSGGRFSGD